MLTFPSIPTDSLYKFIFVAGTALIISGIYLSKSEISNFANQFGENQKLQEYKTDTLRLVSGELIQLNRDIQKQEDTVDSILKNLEQAKSKNKLITNRALIIKNLHLKLASIQKQGDKHDLLYVKESNLKIDTLFSHYNSNLQDAEYKMNDYVYKRMIYLGFILIFVGGFCWWFFIQRYQDALLKLQYLDVYKKLYPDEEKTK